MKKVSVNTEAIIFSDEEIKRLKVLLRYCQHRIVVHQNCGLSHIFWVKDFIDYLLANL